MVYIFVRRLYDGIKHEFLFVNRDAPPIIPTDTNQGYKQMKAKIGSSKVRPWKWMPFTNPARKVCNLRIDSVLYGLILLLNENICWLHYVRHFYQYVDSEFLLSLKFTLLFIVSHGMEDLHVFSV